MKKLLQGEGIRNIIDRFLPAIAASVITGIFAGGLGIYVMIHLMDARITNLEQLPPRIVTLEQSATKFKPIEQQIDRHEKALERDFARHEQTVSDIAHRTEDQEKRLTRLEALVGEMQSLLSEIRTDIKSLLGGSRKMSLFKQQLEKDIHAVFLNLQEFGELGELAGHEKVPMVVENLALDMPPLTDERPVSYEGVTVYVAASDVPDEFLTMRKTTFRHEEWFVLSSGCEMGLKTIQLYREQV